jgi:hypothetical protein
MSAQLPLLARSTAVRNRVRKSSGELKAPFYRCSCLHLLLQALISVGWDGGSVL